MDQVDVIVVGAGVIGLAVARQLSSQFDSVLLIEKNHHYGEETSSRNSEVIHAGIYYPQNSFKAKFCVAGKHKLYQYCQDRHIPHQNLGKLIVGHSSEDEQRLAEVKEIAFNNGVEDLTWLSKKAISQYPHLQANSALLCPSTGIIDVHTYMQSLLADLESNTGMLVTQTEMIAAQPTDKGFKVRLNSQGEITELACQHLINCGGLHSLTTASKIELFDISLLPTMHYCRGHYFTYQGKSPFKQLIYPVPEKNGLGIHASLDVGGQLKFGPDTHYIDEIHYDVPLSLKEKFVQAIQKYYPDLDPDKLQPGYCGIRPKLQGPNDGFKDFVFQDKNTHGIEGLINLFGIDSPGLTSSLAIAEHVHQLVNHN